MILGINGILKTREQEGLMKKILNSKTKSPYQNICS